MNRLVLVSRQIAKEEPRVIVEQKQAVGIIYLNSLKNLNALTAEMRQDIAHALKQLDSTAAVKVILILSKSPKAFCAGADIKGFGGDSYEQRLTYDMFHEYYSAFKIVKKPIVAGVNGVAFGGGLETALLCDFIVLSETAKIGLPQITLGLIPGIGGTQRLKLILGKNLAMKHILTGEPIQASKIKQLGTIDVIPTKDFDQEMIKIAQKISSKSLSALITAKMAVNSSVELPLTQGQQFQRAIFYPLFSTEGAKEGVSAFIEKRKPDFTNK